MLITRVAFLVPLQNARMKVQSDAEQSIEHLLKKLWESIWTADLIVQRSFVKSHASQAHVERAIRLVENQYRVTRCLQRQHGY